MSCPYGVSVSDSYIFIADTNNNLIRYLLTHLLTHCLTYSLPYLLTYSLRQVQLSTGIISTLIGSGTNSGFSGDGGPATSAVIFHPYGIDHHSNDIYFADFHNNRIRKLSDTGTYSLTHSLAHSLPYSPTQRLVVHPFLQHFVQVVSQPQPVPVTFHRISLVFLLAPRLLLKRPHSHQASSRHVPRQHGYLPQEPLRGYQQVSQQPEIQL